MRPTRSAPLPALAAAFYLFGCSSPSATTGPDQEPALGAEPTGTPVFASQFGNGDVRDGGRFFDRLDGEALLDVVPAPHDGWPDNALRIGYAHAGASLIGARGWSIPEPGESLYFRLLLANHLESNAPISTDHGMQSNIGVIRHTIVVTGGDADSWGMGFGHNNNQGGHREYVYYTGPLPKRHPLRIEWALHRLDLPGFMFRPELRVYDDVTGELLASEETIQANTATDARGTLAEDDVPWDLGSEFETGQYLFGSSGSGLGASGVTYVTAIAICEDNWCGPWGGGS